MYEEELILKIKELPELYVHELQDLLSAETQIIQALPKMIEASTDPNLAQAFSSHLEETEEQKTRLEELLDSMGEDKGDVVCKAMKGLIAEGSEALKEVEPGPVLDAALIGSAQRIEHYEIAGYGNARALAAQLGHDDHIDVLQMTLDEEGAADKKLTEIAMSSVNGAAGSSGKSNGSSKKSGSSGDSKSSGSEKSASASESKSSGSEKSGAKSATASSKPASKSR